MNHDEAKANNWNLTIAYGAPEKPDVQCANYFCLAEKY